MEPELGEDVTDNIEPEDGYQSFPEEDLTEEAEYAAFEEHSRNLYSNDEPKSI